MVLSELSFSIDLRTCDPAKTDMEWMSIDQSTNPCVAQLIDANLDRAREGLRVIEDWCRFGLNQKELVVLLKDCRQQLGKHHHQIYKNARSTSKDQGIGISHPAQFNRDSPEQIISANCSRVQEALRVLEEFTRTTDPNLSTSASKIRYTLYDLEITILKSTLQKKRKQKLENCNLCLITAPQKGLPKIVAKALKSGLKMLQYRCKEGTDFERLMEAKELAALCKEHEALFIINDRVDLALAVDADGVHLGQADIPTDVARHLLGPEKLIGRSTHSLQELKKAEDEGCNYLGVGPTYSTQTKPNLKPTGISYLKEAFKATQLPLFAIGGINLSNLNEVLSSGATRIAVAGAIMSSNDPAIATHELLEKMS